MSSNKFRSTAPSSHIFPDTPPQSPESFDNFEGFDSDYSSAKPSPALSCPPSPPTRSAPIPQPNRPSYQFRHFKPSQPPNYPAAPPPTTPTTFSAHSAHSAHPPHTFSSVSHNFRPNPITQIGPLVESLDWTTQEHWESFLATRRRLLNLRAKHPASFERLFGNSTLIQVVSIAETCPIETLLELADLAGAPILVGEEGWDDYDDDDDEEEEEEEEETEERENERYEQQAQQEDVFDEQNASHDAFINEAGYKSQHESVSDEGDEGHYNNGFALTEDSYKPTYLSELTHSPAFTNDGSLGDWEPETSISTPCDDNDNNDNYLIQTRSNTMDYFEEDVETVLNLDEFVDKLPSAECFGLGLGLGLNFHMGMDSSEKSIFTTSADDTIVETVFVRVN